MNRKAILYFLLGMTFILVYGLLDPQYVPFPKCPLHSLTGWLCPGCGSQRAIHQVLHGQFGSAFQLNALFIPALVYALYGYSIAYFFPVRWPAIRQKWFGVRAAWISLVLIIVFWIGRNII